MGDRIPDPRGQAPLEVLVEQVADLDPVVVDDEMIGEFALGPGEMVMRTASRGAFVVFAQNVATGRSVALEPAQVWGGWGSFVTLPDLSCAYFVEDFEPFGGHWPRITIDACVGLVRHWRTCYRLDEDVAALAAALVRVCGEGDPHQRHRLDAHVRAVDRCRGARRRRESGARGAPRVRAGRGGPAVAVGRWCGG